ncbi:MAG: hypothetical protein RIE23_02550 [Pontimonas sp.]
MSDSRGVALSERKHQTMDRKRTVTAVRIGLAMIALTALILGASSDLVL